MMENMDKRLEKAFSSSVKLVYDNIREKCPVRTGRLKNSLVFTAENNTGEISTDVEYAAMVEFGAGGRRPRAFMKNGLDLAKGKIAEIYGEEIING